MHSVKSYLDKHPVLSIALLSLPLALFTVFFLTSALSPLYPANSYCSIHDDAAFFLWCGKQICSGKKPYIDFYDHKGLLVFLYSALGYRMGGKPGLLFLCGVFDYFGYFLTLLAVYQLRGERKDLILGGGILLTLNCFMPSGNQVGSILLPFVALPLIFFLKAQKENPKKNYRIGTLLAGLALGIALNARLTDGLVPFALCLSYLVLFFFHRKEYGIELLYNILLAFLGFGIPCLFVSLYAFREGYFMEMIKENLLVNAAYSIESNSLFYRLVVLFYVLTGTLLSILGIRKKDKDFDLYILFLVTVLVPGIFNIIDAKFPQYWISSFPFLSVFFTFFLSKLPVLGKKKKLSLPVCASVVFLFAPLAVSATTSTIFYTNKVETYSVQVDHDTKALIDSLVPKEEELKDDHVFYLDTLAPILLYRDNHNTCRYQTYQSWYCLANKDVETDVYSYLEDKKPEYIVFGKDYKTVQTDRSYYQDIISKEYLLIGQNDAGNESVRIYKRK